MTSQLKRGEKKLSLTFNKNKLCKCSSSKKQGEEQRLLSRSCGNMESSCEEQQVGQTRREKVSLVMLQDLDVGEAAAEGASEAPVN